jgi:hypothetical protein
LEKITAKTTMIFDISHYPEKDQKEGKKGNFWNRISR